MTLLPDHDPSGPLRPWPAVPADEGEPVVFDGEHLVRRAFAESTERGIEALYRLYYQPLCSHAVRFVYTKEIAEDLVGEVFFGLWKACDGLVIQHSYRAYLYAAVRHRAYDYLHRELRAERNLVPVDDAPVPSRPDTPQTVVEYDELVQRVERAVHDLPPQCQRVFLMSRFEGRKNAEIAAELGLAPKTVEAHLTRALQQLRRVLTGAVLLWLAC